MQIFQKSYTLMYMFAPILSLIPRTAADIGVYGERQWPPFWSISA